MKKDIFEYSGTRKKVKKSKFKLSHSVKGDIRIGELQPTMVIETMPGDQFDLGIESMHRGMPFIAPVMHRINQWSHTFYTPTRLAYLIQEDWDVFITGGTLGDGYTDGTNKYKPINPCINFQFLVAQLQAQPVTEDNYNLYFGPESLWQFLGMPDMGTHTEFMLIDWNHDKYTYLISLIPFQIYQKIYFEYYADQTMETDTFRLKGLEAKEYTLEDFFVDGFGAFTDTFKYLFAKRWRNFEKDYFTTALPFTQRGPEITLDIDAEVDYLDVARIRRQGGGSVDPNTAVMTDTTPGGQPVRDAKVAGQSVGIENIQTILGSFTVNALRVASRLQEWMEKQARGGARYVETFLNHFDIHVGDMMTKRPELIGTTIQGITISEVLQTGQPTTTSTLPQGNMSGHSISIGGNKIGRCKTKEYGFLMTINSLLPENSYANTGVPRYMTNRQDKLEYAWPEFANLGEQEVFTREIDVLDIIPGQDNTTPSLFGYQSRYVEMKQIPDITRGAQTKTLLFWNLARKFKATPVLSEEFINSYFQQLDENEEPFSRIFAVQSTPQQFLFQQINHVSVIRALPYFNNPKL